MQKINEFVETLLKEKGISIDDLEAKKQVVADMAKKLEAEINRAAVNALSDEKAQELADKIKNLSESEIAEFFKNAGVNIEKTTEDTMKKFRELYLGGKN
ncbi:hypothetical protein IJG92_03325 [Candidatus Saccharibacteria bacterium]|nr:hypothetical protein [Candidatus Saccharibacteria bacterium]MBQ6149899.1 hypothetical protein [Candidatus Saccharibacteria bacterium]